MQEDHDGTPLIGVNIMEGSVTIPLEAITHIFRIMWSHSAGATNVTFNLSYRGFMHD